MAQTSGPLRRPGEVPAQSPGAGRLRGGPGSPGASWGWDRPASFSFRPELSPRSPAAPPLPCAVTEAGGGSDVVLEDLDNGPGALDDALDLAGQLNSGGDIEQGGGAWAGDVGMRRVPSFGSLVPCEALHGSPLGAGAATPSRARAAPVRADVGLASHGHGAQISGTRVSERSPGRPALNRSPPASLVGHIPDDIADSPRADTGAFRRAVPGSIRLVPERSEGPTPPSRQPRGARGRIAGAPAAIPAVTAAAPATAADAGSVVTAVQGSPVSDTASKPPDVDSASEEEDELDGVLSALGGSKGGWFDGGRHRSVPVRVPRGTAPAAAASAMPYSASPASPARDAPWPGTSLRQLLPSPPRHAAWSPSASTSASAADAAAAGALPRNNGRM